MQTELDKKSDELNALLVEIVKNQKNSYKNLIAVFLTVVVSFTIIICALVGCFAWYESQFEYEIVGTETIEQGVSGECSAINNVGENQYNDNAIHNKGGKKWDMQDKR